jgi:hypothetical protein
MDTLYTHHTSYEQPLPHESEANAMLSLGTQGTHHYTMLQIHTRAVRLIEDAYDDYDPYITINS